MFSLKLNEEGKSFDSIKLPDSYGVAKNLEVQYEQAKSLFRQTKLPMAIKNGCCVTCDFSQKGADFFVMTLHFINDAW